MIHQYNTGTSFLTASTFYFIQEKAPKKGKKKLKTGQTEKKNVKKKKKEEKKKEKSRKKYEKKNLFILTHFFLPS